jgi:hypothetical protein
MDGSQRTIKVKETKNVSGKVFLNESQLKNHQKSLDLLSSFSYFMVGQFARCVLTICTLTVLAFQ